jgi:hypothetical protein
MKNLIIEEKIECVVMLCRLIESGKNRCSDYIRGNYLTELNFRFDFEGG